MDNMSEFTEWLNEELQNRAWRQADLVRATGITRSAISQLLAGDIRPAPQTVLQLAKVFKIPPDFIMRKVGYLPPRKEGGDPVYEELEFKMSLLPEGAKRQVLDYMDYLLHRHERDEVNDENTVESTK